MNARDRNVAVIAAADVVERMKAIAWERVSQDLDARGSAVIDGLLAPDECAALATLYPIDDVFRSRVVMARHGFGRGEYKYFSYPLPDMVAGLRTTLYPHLAPIANRWNAAMGMAARFPGKHAEFIARCHDAGQLRPTPLLLEYGAGDYKLPASGSLRRARLPAAGGYPPVRTRT